MEEKTNKATCEFQKKLHYETRANDYNLKRLNLSGELNLEQGVYIVKSQEQYAAHFMRSLGFKNMVADFMFEVGDKTYYDQIAQDAAASVINRVITVGAQPLFLSMAIAASVNNWIECKKRSDDLISGWKQSCTIAKCSNAGIIINPANDMIAYGGALLTASIHGIISNEKNLIAGNIAPGDAIVIIRSSGVHASGFDLINKISRDLKDGYQTKIGKTEAHPSFGETLLIPTPIYSPLIRECQKKNINIHYAIDIDNWLDLMRHSENFRYIIEDVPAIDPIFNFMQEKGVDDRTAYSTFNMNAGFALYVPQEEAELTVKLAEKQGFKANVSGHIEKCAKKELIIKEKNLVYTK